jgi:DNA modification methylase
LEIASQLVDLAVPISSLKSLEGNPRRGDVKAVARSLRRFGQRKPIVVDADGTVIAGNHTLAAAIELGWTEIAAVRSDDDEATARAYALADNRTSALGSYDSAALAAMVAEVQAVDPELLVAASFHEDEVRRLLYGESGGKTPRDALPATPSETTTKFGDVWQLGPHRLACGDSTLPETYEALMKDTPPAALFCTDPPYCVDYTGKRPSRSTGNEHGKDWSAVYQEIEIPDARVFYDAFTKAAMPHVRENAAWYLWHGHKWAGMIVDLWNEIGVLPHQQIVWVKPSAMFSTAYFNWRHETCLFGWREGHRPDWVDIDLGAHTTSVWEISYDGGAKKQQKEHPTQKPVELFALPMRIHTKPGDVCLEPFSGSGSQIIAAEMEGRVCRAIEREPVFVDVAVRRWENFTGEKATRID